jgi:hypothetical protein
MGLNNLMVPLQMPLRVVMIEMTEKMDGMLYLMWVLHMDDTWLTMLKLQLHVVVT